MLPTICGGKGLSCPPISAGGEVSSGPGSSRSAPFRTTWNMSMRKRLQLTAAFLILSGFLPRSLITETCGVSGLLHSGTRNFAPGKRFETIKRLAAPAGFYIGDARRRTGSFGGRIFETFLDLTGGPKTFSFNNPHAAQPLRLYRSRTAPARRLLRGVVLTDLWVEEFRNPKHKKGRPP